MSDTREYIIDQAYSLFLTHSYEAVSISDISKAIGFTKGALYHHFKSKEELFKAVIDKYLLIEERIGPTGEVSSFQQFIEESIRKAERIVNSYLGEKPKFFPLSYMALFIDMFRHYPAFSKEKFRFIQNEIKKIEDAIIYAIGKGELRKDIDPGIMALNYFSLGLGIASNLLLDGSPKQAIEILRNQLYELYKVMKA